MRRTTRRGLQRLHNLKDETEATAAEMAIERGRFDQIRDDGPTVAVSAFNLFQTPEPIAWQLAGMIPAGGRVLEPSAGLGRLVSAIDRRARPDELVAVEIAPQCAEQLYRLDCCELWQRDFLELTPDDLGLFDAILMNPPFKMGRDIKHIRHAYKFLKPGGLLVALCFNGVRQNKELRPWAGSWSVLPEESFKAEGTRASVALMTRGAWEEPER